MHPGRRNGEHTVGEFEQVCFVSLVPVLTHLVFLPNGRLVLRLAVLLSGRYLDGLLEDSNIGICLSTMRSRCNRIYKAWSPF